MKNTPQIKDQKGFTTISFVTAVLGTVANVRAMVSSPPILLLDEFTAGLDADNEAHAVKAMTDNRPVNHPPPHTHPFSKWCQ